MLLKGILQLCKGGSFGRRLMTVGNRYRFGKEEKDYGIKFDEEQIKKKIEEIKSRKQKVKGKVQEKLNFMRINTNNQILRKVRKFREQTGTQNLLHFSDPTVEEKPTTLQITGYDQNSIEVDTMPYPPSMIIFRTQLLVWEVLSVEQLTIDDFTILKYISPKPTYVIVGVNDVSKFPIRLREQLQSKFQNFDVLQLFQATSQFNVTSNDDIEVVAFLISK